MNTEALRSLVACYRDPTEAQKRVDNPHQLAADLDAFEAAADTIDRLRARVWELEKGGQSIPEGYQLVPVEPTTPMLNAAIDAHGLKLGDISPLGFRMSPQKMFAASYAAMLTVASSEKEGKQ